MKILVAAGKEPTDRTDVLDVLRCRESVARALTANGHTVGNLDITPARFSHPEILTAEIAGSGADLVFNLFEGWSFDSGAEAVFAEILEKSGIRFTGNSSSTLSFCLDKMKVKTRLIEEGVPVPEGSLIRFPSQLDLLDRNTALFIKPHNEDGNVGIDETSFISPDLPLSEVRKMVENKLRMFPEGLIAEEFIPGIEYSVGCIGKFPYTIIGISVMDYSRHRDFPPFYTYAAKWDESDPVFSALTPVQGTRIPAAIEIQIKDIVRKAGAALNLTSYFRIDTREKNNTVYVLDINPNPDINDDGGLAQQAAAYGMTYRELIARITNSGV